MSCATVIRNAATAANSRATRRAAVQAAGRAEHWARGRFVLPNPVYGTALAGTFDDLFPMDKRWVDPAATEGTQ